MPKTPVRPFGTYPRLAPKGIYPGESWVKPAYFQATHEWRPPLKGEYYLSGGPIEAYKVLNDLSDPFWIAREVAMMPCHCCQGTGKVVQGWKQNV